MEVWWPLNLSDQELGELKDARLFFEDDVTLHVQPNRDSAEALAQTMAEFLPQIIEKDGMPHLCHIINGWGNVQYKGQELLQLFECFIHNLNRNQPHFLQCNPEGDFHPWQTFAYSFMAGVEADYVLQCVYGGNVTLQELAGNSGNLNTGKGVELGHMLYSLAHLKIDPSREIFIFDNKKHTLHSLLDVAEEAHVIGGFEVCRKFHLTEGICAVAKKFPEFHAYQKNAQTFLDGQLDMLYLLAAIMRYLEDDQFKITAGDMVCKLRNTLNIGHLIENHFYYAGHLIELATLAYGYGYNISRQHFNVMHYVVNHLNKVLNEYLPHLPFMECFLTLGHYRRAITLLERIKEVAPNNDGIPKRILRDYTINFDDVKLEDLPKAHHSLPPDSVKCGGQYNIAKIIQTADPFFLEVIEEYSKIAPKDLLPKGAFPHFRRISPPSWPRSIHYELLYENNKLSLEIHMEAQFLMPIKEQVLGLSKKIKQAPNLKYADVAVDKQWYHGCGRISVSYDSSCLDSEIIVKDMLSIIDLTFADLNQLILNDLY